MVYTLPGLLMVGETTSTLDITNLLVNQSVSNVGVLARSQTSGQGRGDHQWTSPPGGLYLSWCSEQKRFPEICTLNLLATWEVRAAILEHCDCSISIKWPNDLVIEDKKLGGVLIRVITIGNTSRLTFGIGLNLQIRDFPPALLGQAVSLEQLGLTPPARQSLALNLMARINAAILNPPATFERLRPDIEKQLSILGEPVRINAHNGLTIQGTATGLDEYGGLVIATQDRTSQVVYEGSLWLNKGSSEKELPKR